MKQFSVFLFIFLIASLGLCQEGAVDVLISQGGLPVENYDVRIANQDYKTDAFGFVTVALKPGSHNLSIKDGKQYKSIAFDVAQGERTQLVVNIFREQIVSDLNQPTFEKQEVQETSGETGELKLELQSVNGEPVAGAKVFARGTQVSGTTDRSGNLLISLPIGEQTISVTHPKFSTQVVRNITIQKAEMALRKIELTPSGLVLEDFIVLAPNLKGSIQALIEVRRKAADVADVMSSEQMAKSGDSDAAGSLKRVTGLTLKDGKYVYVRGMGERYSATLLNGISLPSPDPSRRVVPLDLFPVQFLESMIIQKSYSPNQPGSFGGGVVQLQTKSMPDKFFIKASISQTQNSNDGNMKTYAGGGTDWLGVDDGTRKRGDGVKEDPQLILENNRHALQEQRNETLPNLSVSLGDSFKMGPVKLGYTVSGLYKDNINYTNETRFRYIEPAGVAEIDQDYTREKTQKERTAGGIAGLQLELFKNHKISTNYINIRNTTDYVAILEGNDEESRDIRETQIEWAARTLQTLMVQGENKIPQAGELQLNWYVAESRARRDEPYRTNYRYAPDENTGEYLFSLLDDDAYERRYYDLQERADDRGVSLQMPIPWFYKKKARIEAGFSQTTKNRSSSMTRYQIGPGTEPCNADLTNNLDNIFDECGDNLRVTDNTQPTDNYLATQDLKAYYFKSQLPLLPSVDLSTGMRFEDSTQSVDTITALGKQPVSSTLKTQDWLPGSSLTWKMNKKMQMRAAYSETISRPDLRELSETRWQDFEYGFDVQGNPNLKSTVIESYDLRWEWYFTPKENLSFGVFYKDFTEPIEQVFTAGSDPRLSFFNVEGATLYGAEIELSKNLGFVGSWLRRFTLSGNYAYIFSDVILGDLTNSESTETSRPLQGQSPYTVNFLLDYEHEPWRLNASLAYNVYGPRIALVMSEGLEPVWEQPFQQLDFVMRKKLGKKLSVQTKIQNLLDAQVHLKQYGETWSRYKRGQTYTVGVAMGI